MDLNKVEELVLPYLKENNLSLYEILFVKEYGYQILRVSVDKVGGIDVDTLSKVNEYLALKLDEIDADMPEYMLEVCSPGAEKTLRNEDEILNSVGMHVNVKTKEVTYEGTLMSFENNVLSIKINIKGRFKTVTVNYDEVKKIRLAVKF